MFSGIASSYDLNNRLHSLGRDQAWRRAAVRLAEVRPADRVLDVACGTGDLTEAFASAGPAEVVGLDFAEPMLEIARGKTSRRERPDGVPTPRYVGGDATALPFEDDAFDIVSIAFGIRNVTDPAQAVREFRRVTSPGGRLVVLEFSQPRNPILRGLSRFYTNRVMPLTATWLARDRTGAYRYLPKSVDTFLSREAMTGMMEAAGYGEVRQKAMSCGVCVAYVAGV
ncbi:MAG: bifunctional demethylmenaquinone methyltransferase/2-methoxy-6-polyprenyl-1,4-benzoquinol methylase UbiE [Planctomycetes bacterium]|nr:bifunctional demethylmenaquinone methyltransferase/2-methoxy-6-polyprenyl-1,4-benzoquinol methylase UbiE [Planctomycetota bacterium]